MEGQVARSNELITAATLLVMFITLKAFSGYMSENFLKTFNLVYSQIEVYSKEELRQM